MSIDSPDSLTYTVCMATQLYDGIDYLTDAEGLLHALRALMPHHVLALAWTVRALENDAKRLRDLAGNIHDDHVADRLESLSSRAVGVANQIKSRGFFNILARRSLLRSAVLYAQAACLVRSENPSNVPTLDSLWRSAVDAMADIFRFV